MMYPGINVEGLEAYVKAKFEIGNSLIGLQSNSLDHPILQLHHPVGDIENAIVVRH